MKKYIYVIFLLFAFIFVINRTFILERFTSQINEDNKTTHNVDMPINNPYSCKNFCGPTARCSITGQQCFTDIDCPGCKPPTTEKGFDGNDVYVEGDNDSGKLTVGVTPTYSSLTSGYGTKERIITKDLYERPSPADFGANLWATKANIQQKLFDKRYKPPTLKNMPQYAPMYSLTGEFLGDGPLPSNF